MKEAKSNNNNNNRFIERQALKNLGVLYKNLNNKNSILQKELN